MSSQTKVNNRSLERALQILCVFSSGTSEYSLGELSSALSLPKSTVYRLATTLTQFRFLKYDANRQKYSLGFKLLELGGIVLATFSIRSVASPHLVTLQTKTKKSVFLGILHEGELLYLDKRDDPESPIRFSTTIGFRRQPYFGMLGQVLLAALPGDEVKGILETNPLKPITPKSISTQDELFERLKMVNAQGYAFEKGEVIEGCAGIAAPIRDYAGRVVAAIGLRFIYLGEDEKAIERLIYEVCKTAGSISKDLGCSGDFPGFITS